MQGENCYFNSQVLDSSKKFVNRGKGHTGDNNKQERNNSACDVQSYRRSFAKQNYSNMYEKPLQYQPEVLIEGVSRRREANARERLRVRNLNSGFAKLRRIIPTVPPNRKPSKVDTLQGAIDYIHQLEVLLEATGGVPDIGVCSTGNIHSHSRQSVTECPFFPLQDFQPRNSARFSIFSERISETRRKNLKQRNFNKEQLQNPAIQPSPENVEKEFYFAQMNQSNYSYT